jgi:hypothetical protein
MVEASSVLFTSNVLVLIVLALRVLTSIVSVVMDDTTVVLTLSELTVSVLAVISRKLPFTEFNVEVSIVVSIYKVLPIMVLPDRISKFTVVVEIEDTFRVVSTTIVLAVILLIKLEKGA